MTLSIPKYEPREHEWRNDAACRDTDPALFFPVGSKGMAAHQVIAAKKVCLSCPSARECLDFALDTCQDAGVWGGLDEEERRVIRRRRRAQRKAEKERQKAKAQAQTQTQTQTQAQSKRLASVSISARPTS